MSQQQEPDFGALEQTLEAFQENARQLAVIASDYQPKSQEVLNQKLQTLVSGLQEIERSKHQFQDVKIPLELFTFLDDGKNPQLYTTQCMNATLKKNKEVNGKVELYKKFRAYLLKELSEEMKDDTMLYRCIRERSNGLGSHDQPASSSVPDK